MGDIVDINFLERALETAGLRGAEVTTFDDAPSMSTVIRVKKTVNGEPITASHAVSDREIMQADDEKQLFATVAEQLARNITQQSTERVKWGENAVVFDESDGHSIECLRCGASASLDDIDRGRPILAETPVPNPETRANLSSLPQAKIRMALHALLRDECDPMCPNSEHYGEYRKI